MPGWAIIWLGALTAYVLVQGLAHCWQVASLRTDVGVDDKWWKKLVHRTKLLEGQFGALLRHLDLGINMRWREDEEPQRQYVAEPIPRCSKCKQEVGADGD